MLSELQGMARGLDAMLASLDPALLRPSDAARVLDAAVGVEQRAASLKTLVAGRAADSGEWAQGGHRSPEDWLATKSGSGYGAAAGTLNASEKLKKLPELEAAVRKGKLSGSKVNEVAKAATPDNERKLVDAAERENFRQLKKTCARAKAEQRCAERDEARHQRIHTERYHKGWYDEEGAYCYAGRTTAAAGARMEAAVEAETDNVFKQAYAEGRREAYSAYRADAVLNLICGGGANVDTTVVVRVDESRLRGEEGMCEAAATGPIPVSDVIGAMLAGAFIKVVAHDGTEITRVAHYGRHVPAEVKTAIFERDGYTCVRPGCGATANLELHHYRVEHAKGGPVACWNVCCVCRHCHRLLTHGGHRLEGGPGSWTWIPPP